MNLMGMLGLPSKFVKQVGSSMVMLFNPRSGEISTYSTEGEKLDALRPEDARYEEVKYNTFPDVHIGDAYTVADALAADCAHKRVYIAMVMRSAKWLISRCDNPEYVKGITDLICDITNFWSSERDQVLQTIQTFEDKHASTKRQTVH